MHLTADERKRLHDLCDLLLLNAPGLSSSGLARGKAGVTIALFEAASLLEDGYLEDQAFSLLQEILLSKLEDISFESGWSGIAFTLIYLVRNNMLEADIHPILDRKTEWMHITECGLLAKDPLWGVKNPEIAVMWHLLGGNRFASYRDVVLQTMANHINLFLSCMDKGTGVYVSSKKKVMQEVQRYLRTVLLCGRCSPREALLSRYIALFDCNRFRSEAETGHYLIQLGRCHQKDSWIQAGRQQLETAAHTELEDCDPLYKKLTRYFHMLHYDSYARYAAGQTEQRYLLSSPDRLEEELKELTSWETAGIGLGFGIARLLVFLCAVCRWREGQDISRYNPLIG